MKKIALALGLILAGFTLQAQDATEIIKKADQKMRGESSYAEMVMRIIRPDWSREISMKSWSYGTEYALILITGPARDKGIGYLKRGNEIWNWQPSIDRTVKLPPSMMSQSWMGSDFTNDDLVKESSIVNDYTHRLTGDSTINGYAVHKINLTPKEDAAVVWGKIEMYISKDEYLQLLSKFYDEEMYLIHSMKGKEIKRMDDRLITSVIEVIPADDEDQKTVMEYENIDFNIDIKPDFFSIQNMKQLRP